MPIRSPISDLHITQLQTVHILSCCLAWFWTHGYAIMLCACWSTESASQHTVLMQHGIMRYTMQRTKKNANSLWLAFCCKSSSRLDTSLCCCDKCTVVEVPLCWKDAFTQKWRIARVIGSGGFLNKWIIHMLIAHDAMLTNDEWCTKLLMDDCIVFVCEFIELDSCLVGPRRYPEQWICFTSDYWSNGLSWPNDPFKRLIDWSLTTL